MKKAWGLTLIVLLLAGCGQLHPNVEKLSEAQSTFSIPKFSISITDFNMHLLEKGMIHSIEEQEDGWTYYEGMDQRIKLETFYSTEHNDSVTLVNIRILEPRPLQNAELMNNFYPFLQEVLFLLDNKMHTQEEVNKIITIRRMDELFESKINQPSPLILINTMLMQDQNDKFFMNIRIEPLFNTSVG